MVLDEYFLVNLPFFFGVAAFLVGWFSRWKGLYHPIY